jgi:GTP-binding protein
LSVFVDIAEITVEGGSGGNGCVSFRRQKHLPRGGPDGGRGGRGGSVWLIASPECSTLLDFRYRRHYRAGNGQHGQGQCRSGADGKDCQVPVPPGTSVSELPSGVLLGDLVASGDRLCVALGGRGGKGNHDFRRATNQAPRFAQAGRPGQVRRIRLELKMLADIGLIGAPNAGKSTLLGALSSARPKIDSYPFTTLVPNLGLVDLGDFTSCVVADIPGLIEGASQGKGLGTEFLRHVERTRALVLLADLTAGPPVRTLRMLRLELAQYGRRLPDLAFAVALTKCDLVDGVTIREAERQAETWLRAERGVGIATISAMTGAGMADIRRLIRRLHHDSLPQVTRTD